MRKKELIFAAIITLILTAGDMFAFPLGLFLNIQIADVEPIFITLMFNQWMLVALSLLLLPRVCPNLDLRLTKDGFVLGIRRYGLSCAILFVVPLLAFCIGFIGKYDYTPTVLKVLIEGFLYYIGVGMIEELYIRGLLLNILRQLFRRAKRADVTAILCSSLLFSLGHIPGMLGQNTLTIICRLLWTLMLGIYLGTIYCRTKNLWVPIVFHAVIDFCAVPFCFTTLRMYPAGVLIVIALCFLLTGGKMMYDYLKET